MGEVTIWEEELVIPTYEIGAADKNPMFLEGRVYQGSSGKIYPYPTIESISDVKTDRAYRAVWLENEYLKVMVQPELGGCIQRAYDKTNGYDFVYYNHVIKPALVRLCGPWISGGIEFNWPQHHRPTSYSPVDYLLTGNPDGSKTCRVSDVDQMYGAKGEASFTLYPGRAYIEIRGQLYNRTSQPQTFLWWANPAVPENENTHLFPSAAPRGPGASDLIALGADLLYLVGTIIYTGHPIRISSGGGGSNTVCFCQGNTPTLAMYMATSTFAIRCRRRQRSCSLLSILASVRPV